MAKRAKTILNGPVKGRARNSEFVPAGYVRVLLHRAPLACSSALTLGQCRLRQLLFAARHMAAERRRAAALDGATIC
jgi:hypothetical protein